MNPNKNISKLFFIPITILLAANFVIAADTRDYKELLITAAPLMLTQTGRDDKVWTELKSKLTQEVLDDAFAKTSEAKTHFSEFGPLSARTSPKVLNRITDYRGEWAPTGKAPFNANNDLIAFRLIENNPAQALKTANDIVRKQKSLEGVVANVKFGSESTGLIDDENNPKDIVYFVYIFNPAIGYIVEIQIGAEFAFEVFARDSYLAVHGGKDHLIDLWEKLESLGGKSFYDVVKNNLLSKEPLVSNDTLDNALSEMLAKKPSDESFVQKIRNVLKLNN